MANNPAPVGIVRTCSHFDGKSPHWLGMSIGMGNPRLFQLGMSMENPRLFQLGMGMGMRMYISPP